MGKKGSGWFSTVKKVFKPSSKDLPPDSRVSFKSSTVLFCVYVSKSCNV